jgi:putative phosphoribosyl transferase
MHRARFSDRIEAGQALAEALHDFSDGDDVVVLALPRGGVPVGFEVARGLNAPLDVIVVRKIGAPGQQELAMGAVASGGVIVRNESVLSAMRVDEATFSEAAEQKRLEVRERDTLFRGARDELAVSGKVVIVVDDGIATGSTVSAAVHALKQLEPARVVVAVPVASTEAVNALESLADDTVVLKTPTPFMAVGHWYDSFPQVPDKEVLRLLRTAAEWDNRS